MTSYHHHYKKLLALLLITAFIGSYSCRTNYAPTTERFTASVNERSLERGRNLTFIICGGCHYNEADKKFTGKPLAMIPKIAGNVHASNITKPADTAMVGYYSDAALRYLIQTGIANNGRFVPYMMRPNISLQDINDIIVYLRSDDPAIASGPSNGRSHLNLLGKMGMRMVTKVQPFKANTPSPDENNPIAYGRYLVDITGCFHCHSKKATSVNYLFPEKTKGYMAGGAKAETNQGKIRGSNLTFDMETGIGMYSKEAFRKSVQQNIDRNGHVQRPPMEAFPMTDKQVDAVYEYLKSLPRKKHRIRQ